MDKDLSLETVLGQGELFARRQLEAQGPGQDAPVLILMGPRLRSRQGPVQEQMAAQARETQARLGADNAQQQVVSRVPARA